MSQKDVCLLGAGGWPPKNNADGHQLPRNIGDFKAENKRQSGPFSDDDKERIRAAIKKKYSSVSASAEGYFKYPVGKAGAILLGYDPAILEDIPAEMLRSFCGVGNPFAIDRVEEGSIILDIGCGAGIDLLIASQLAGPSGKVVGVDLTKEMVDKARANLKSMQIKDYEIHQISSERLPFEDDTFDVVISNGVINLSPDKPHIFAEIYRVLKKGGRLQFADIILEKELPTHLTASVESWSQWIGGAVPGRDQLTLMEDAGFTEIAQLGKTSVKTSEYTVGALFKGNKP
jgi:arsenite methyltransferase